MTTATRAPTTLPADHGRAVLPDRTGLVARPNGVRLAFEVFGSGDPTLVLLPSAPIIHSRQWKGQVPYLSRSYRVVTFDGPGNGRSDRPTDPAAYQSASLVNDIEAVMDATETEAAVLVGLCGDGVWPAILLAAAMPERVLGIVAFATGVPLLSPPHPWRVQWSFDDEWSTDVGWAKVNRHYFRRDYRGFAQFFFGEMLTEPHSTKQLEDAVGWALDGSVDAMLAEAAVVSDWDLAEVEGAGHMIPGRQPVLANLLIRDFARSIERTEP